VDSNLDKELTELSNLFLSTLKKMSDFTLSDIHILQSLTDKQKSVESAFRELLFHEFDLKPDTYLTSPVEQCLKLLSPENINNKT
jgi:hypothetical protein